MASDLTAAADTIDHLIDALPGGQSWNALGAHVLADGFLIATAAKSWPPLERDALAALIAALASPDRARALAQLLRALDGERDGNLITVHLDDIFAAAQDLAALINQPSTKEERPA